MANLRNLENFNGDFSKENLYDHDNKQELEDNILFLFEQLENNEFSSNEAVEHLKDIMKNYYGNIILDFLN